MKKEYKKPLINIDDFEVTERIAGACAEGKKTIVTTAHDFMCILKWQEYFVDETVCANGDPGIDFDNNTGCLDTYVGVEEYFWS